MRIEFKGRYQLSVERDGEITQQTPWFDNLITDNGLDLIATGYSVNCYVGSGTTPAEYTDMQLENYVASLGASFSHWSSGAGLSETPQYRSHFRRYRAGIGAISGQVSEVGIGPSSTNLVSRALLPVVLQLDGELDRLYVTWEFRQCIPDGVIEGAVFLAGATRTYSAYPLEVESQLSVHFGSDNSRWNVRPGRRIFQSSMPKERDSAHAIRLDGSWKTSKSGSIYKWKAFLHPYIAGSHAQHLYIPDFGPGWTGEITGFRFGQGLYAGSHRWTNGGYWEVMIDPPIQIEDHQRLHVDFAICWGRCSDAGDGCEPGSYPSSGD